MFWLGVGGLGFTLVLGTGVSELLDSPAAYVLAAAVWAVIAWQVLAWLQRRAERTDRTLRELDGDDRG